LAAANGLAVKSVAGEQLSVREIELLTHGYLAAHRRYANQTPHVNPPYGRRYTETFRDFDCRLPWPVDAVGLGATNDPAGC